MRLLKLIVVAASVLVSTACIAAENLRDRLAAAKAGDTIELAAGQFEGGFTLPAGVSLKGAGFDKTVIDATHSTNGIMLEGGKGTQLVNLTVRGAKAAGVALTKSESVVLSGVRVTGCAIGFQLNQCDKGRLENCISDHNSFGISLSRSADCVVVNCTVSNCAELGLSFAACPNLVSFNNCVVGSSLCLSIDDPAMMHLDHNLYFGALLGQMKEQNPKHFIFAWHYLTELDAHSLQMPVDFKDTTAGDFTPTSLLTWSPDRATTSDWGLAEYAGVKAPMTDIQGHARSGRPDLGAVEASPKPPRPADGQFTIASDAGTKSAGAFTKDGKLIAYLFQQLPLAAGKYDFWLPERDYIGRPIPAGDHEVRVAESDFRWQYLNHVGDNGEDLPLGHTAPFNPAFVTYASNGTLVMQEGPSEDHAGVRGYDPVTGKLRWYMHGALEAQGLVAGPDGTIYVLSQYIPQDHSRLTRVNADTGEVIPWENSKDGHRYIKTPPQVYSLTLLKDRLYTADASTGKLFVFSKSTGELEKTLDAPAPRYVVADDKNNLLWIASGDSLVALDADGKKVAESNAVKDPVALAYRDGQLAVASGKTGKVHFFDANDPANLKPLREFGRGDGPYGAFEPDRFWFQKAEKWRKPHDIVASVALGPDGQLAVVDHRRTLAFDKTGKNLWYTIGVFGNWSRPSYSTQNRRLWNTDADLSFVMNEKDGSWKPEGLWDHSLVTPDGLQEPYCQPLGDFSMGGKTFLVQESVTCGDPYGPPAGECGAPLFCIARLDGFKSIPVLKVHLENGKLVMREDTNGDGHVTTADTPQELKDAEGKPLSIHLFARANYLESDGSVCIMSYPPMRWKCSGISDKGVPIYEGKNLKSLVSKDWKNDLSPYDLKPEITNTPGSNHFFVPGRLSDGGYVLQATLRGSGGAYLNNGAGTDLCGYDSEGRIRWINQLAKYKGLAGMGTADDITLTAVFYCVETLAVDADGLGLGGFCEPQKLHYPGYWIDHPNLRFFKMPDGNLYASYGDNASGRHPWYRLNNRESLKQTRQPLHVAEDRARQLAALDWKPTPTVGRPPQPKIRISKLAQPLTIDGDLEKWRTAGVQPQIVIRPSSAFTGPADCSAIVRMAYEGQNLYFQVLQFDDHPIFYQMCNQDNVELTLNGAGEGGFQFVVYKTPDGRDIVWRNRFFANIPQIELNPAHVPRVIKVLPDAKDVPEREALEMLYGVDLSKAKVVLSEFMIPLDKETYVHSEKDVIPLGPGKTFTIGFFIDDNDRPYTNLQRLSAWPATFGVFSPNEDAAMAICE